MEAFNEECKSADSEMSKLSIYVKAIHEIKHTTDEHIAARLIDSTENIDIAHIPSHLLKSKEVIKSTSMAVEASSICNIDWKTFLRYFRCGVH